MKSQTLRLAFGSLLVGVVVFGLKGLAWWLTGSVALLADALESTVNVVTALAALVAIRVAHLPADANHPYGHHKAEYFSAVLEGVMVVLAALLILHAAGQALQTPRTLDAPWYGLLVNGLATALNGAWCWMLLQQGRRLRSPALVADGQHLFSDVISSVGVAVGIMGAIATGWLWLDPLLAVLVALNILWSGWQLIKSSLSSLLDEAVPAQELKAIEAVIARTASGAIEVHDLRTRRAGALVFVEFHLIVPGSMTVHVAHAICDHIEQALKAEDSHRVVTIHVEPEEKAKHHGVLAL